MDPKEQESNASDPVVFRPVELGGAPVNLSESQVQRIPSAPSSDGPPWWTWMVPGARRAYQMRNLQAGTSEVMQLVRSIHQSLDQQIETQRLLIASMSALPEAVEGLRHVGKATEAQREMLGVLQRQMDANAGTMDRFNDTLASMDGTTKSIAERAKSSETALFDLLRRAQRRMTLLTVLLVLTIAGVAALASYLMTGGTLPDLRARKAVEAAVPPARAAAAETPAIVATPDVTPDATPDSPPAPPPEPPGPGDEAPAAAAEPLPAPPPVVTVDPVVPEAPAAPEPAVEEPAAVEPAPVTAPAPAAPEPAPEEVKPAEPAPEAAAPAPAIPGQPTEASLRLEKLLKDLRKTDDPPPPETPPLKP